MDRRSKKAESSTARGHGEVWRSAANRNDWRCWEALNPEVLALIFTRIPADELSRAVPFVCRGWWEATAGPYCWADIDIEDWCRRVRNFDVIDAAVRKLVRRSRYTLRRLSAFSIGNWGFSLTASFGVNLKVLQIPMSEVNDSSIEKYSGTLKSLATLDISLCQNITSKGIKILGKNCPSLINLRRNLIPPEFSPETRIDENEALAVANTMLRLEKLELANGRFTDYGLHVILNNCQALSSLDIRGCENVKLAGDVGMMCYLLNTFRDPSYDENELYINRNDGCDDEDEEDDDEDEEDEEYSD